MILELIEEPTTLEVIGDITNLQTSEVYTVLEVGGGGGGPPGPPGEGILVEVQAAENIPAFAFVTSSGFVANSTNLAHYNRVIGIATAAAATGFIVTVNVGGETDNPLWSWSPGSKLFLNGTSISVTPPSSGFSQMVAVAENANSIIVKLEPPILL